MRKQRPKIRKEDIGDPLNFVHVQHVGFGPKPSLQTQRSLDLSQDSGIPGSSSPVIRDTDLSREDSYDVDFQVERRQKGSRSSRIPRHHRSTTAGFPDTSAFPQNLPKTQDSIESPGISDKLGSSLKPFGSLLNLSFLPLGLGKSSLSKSSSINKNKRTSLLNLTAAGLFSNPKPSLEEKRESVHMTGYTRRRSFSSSIDGEDDNMLPPSRDSLQKEKEINDSTFVRGNSNSRIPLAKLGRSQSSMSEFRKRPKLRVILPPTAPPPVPPVQNLNQVVSLPSPPPSPEGTKTATPTTPLEKVVLRKLQNSPPRSRIITLPPSDDSIDSLDPVSPQYLTPAGGCSPLPSESAFPLLSPTLPPSSAPLLSSSRAPGTPPTWPLQPMWPSTFAMQQKEATIPELPSPCKDEMETSEYEPVVSIVDGFLADNGPSYELSNLTANGTSIPVNQSNAERISAVLSDHIHHFAWPNVAHKLFQSVPVESVQESPVSYENSSVKEIYECILTKTLELWSKIAGNHATVERLVEVLDDVNHQAAEMLRQMNLHD